MVQPSGSRSSGGSTYETLVDGTSGPVVRDAEALPPGSEIGRYVVLERIGGGGMGVVYAAYDPKLDRKVAIKLLRRRRGKTGSEELDRARMLREAQALARLSHPNVIAVHDADIHDGRVFVAMDFVEGQDLRVWVEQTHPSVREIVDAYVEAARGLAAAHDAGLVHRDFKPDNAVRDDRGRVRVLDFGLARATGNTGPHGAVPPRSREEIERRLSADTKISLDTPLTVEGAKVGTPAYMAPEQHLGDATDARTDQFALCASLYEALYGELPFCDDSVHALAFASIEGDIRDAPRQSNVPPWLRRVLLRGLAPKPDDRWPSIDALVVQLQRDPARSRRRTLGLGIGALALVAAAWGYTARAPAVSPCQAAPQRLAAVWNAARIDAITTSFAATRRPYAARVAEDAAARMDEFGSAWVQMHTDTCEATEVRHEQSPQMLDLRMACLGRALQSLDALATTFETADADVVDHATEAARGLPSLAPCADLDALRDGPPLPAGSEALLAGLAEANAAHATGREDTAIATGRRLVAEARQVGAPGLLAEALSLLGTALEAKGDYAEAETHLLEAEVAAEEAGDDGLLARIRVVLVLVSGDRLAKPERGRVWAHLAGPTIVRAGNDLGLRVQLETNLGHIASREGNPDESLAHRRRTLELLEEADAPDGLMLASAHAGLASALADRQQLEEARRHAARALEGWTAIFGPDHRRTAYGHAVLAYVHDAAGDYELALAEYERAIEILVAALGPDALPVGEMRTNAGVAAIRLGDYARGEQEFRRSLQIKEAAFGPEHVDVASALGNLSGIVRMRGRIEEAEDFARRALAVREKALPPDHPEVASSLATLANVIESRGDFERVVGLRERVLEIFAKRYGPEHPKLLTDLGNLAYSATHAGQVERAIVVGRRAVAIADANEVPPELDAFARITLAIALSHAHAAEDEIRALADAVAADLGTRSAETERRLLGELAERHGWTDLAAAAEPEPEPEP